MNDEFGVIRRSSSESVGLIGVGLVGTALADNLIAAGYGVVGFDIDGDRLGCLESVGGEPAASASEVGGKVNRVFLALMNSDIVRDVVEGPHGLMEAQSPPSYIVDCSTGDPEQTVRLASRLRERNVSLLDAPISGSSEQIRNREGVFMVGGETEDFEACKDLFEAVAKQFYHVGPSGDGAKAKLASNLILGLNRLVLAEGLVFAERLGLETGPFLALLKKTPSYSCAMDVKGRKLVDGDFTPQSKVAQHAKDLSIILKYAERLGQPLPLTDTHKNILDAAIDAGDGDLDNSAVIRQLRRIAKPRSARD